MRANPDAREIAPGVVRPADAGRPRPAFEAAEAGRHLDVAQRDALRGLAQARELARSGVETVVAVSCDPGTLARDAQILTDGGYAIASVTPIDQFVYAAHVETVAVLRKEAPGRRGAARPRSIS